MASGLSSVVVALALSVVLAPSVSAGSRDCQAYNDQPYQSCSLGFCCGSCLSRYCCQNSFSRFTEDEQEDCSFLFSSYSSPLPMVLGIGSFIIIFLIFICCCVCPCCCMYNMCRKPRPVIATSTHTTVVTTTPQQYPQQPTTRSGQPQAYQGGQYQIYHPVPVQPGYGAQPAPQGYGAQPAPQGYRSQPVPQGYGSQPVSQGYGAQPMPTPAYHGQAIVAGPPPTYQEATGPGFPPNPMPYSQAAFSPGQPAYPLQPPGQPAYPLQPPGQPQPKAPNTDYVAQPAYNPDYTG